MPEPTSTEIKVEQIKIKLEKNVETNPEKNILIEPSSEVKENNFSSNEITTTISPSTAFTKPLKKMESRKEIQTTMIPVPPMLTGWLEKQGRIVKNWKKRFFVLDSGYLRYYDKSFSSAPFGKDLKGSVVLQSYEVHSMIDMYDGSIQDHNNNGQGHVGVLRQSSNNNNGINTSTNEESNQINAGVLLSDRSVLDKRILLVNVSSDTNYILNGTEDEDEESRELIIEAPNAQQKDMWITALKSHIKYAKSMYFRLQFEKANNSSSINNNVSNSSSNNIIPSAASLSELSVEVKQRFSIFLNKGNKEEMIYSSLVNKPNPMGLPLYRQLILTSKARLLYIDEKTMEQKGEVFLNGKGVQITVLDKTKFVIKIASRSYKFIDEVNGSEIWAKLISPFLITK